MASTTFGFCGARASPSSSDLRSLSESPAATTSLSLGYIRARSTTAFLTSSNGRPLPSAKSQAKLSIADSASQALVAGANGRGSAVTPVTSTFATPSAIALPTKAPTSASAFRKVAQVPFPMFGLNGCGRVTSGPHLTGGVMRFALA